jgi:hypothetical protein
MLSAPNDTGIRRRAIRQHDPPRDGSHQIVQAFA